MPVDLRDLTTYLRDAFGAQAPVGAVVGRTAMRDALVQKLGCSELEAEEHVDSLVALKLIVFVGERGEPGYWRFLPDAHS